jgi:hypothetical protein
VSSSSSSSSVPFRQYRLKRGTHQIPNPDYDPTSSQPVASHVVAVAGDVVDLTDEQFKSFHDRFVPLSSESAEVRDDNDEALENAKRVAARTGEPQDPNVPTAHAQRVGR